tara:strand:- start:1150 stop:1326 length:177 start_codon:yes stop_codon:yes gene_type:complete
MDGKNKILNKKKLDPIDILGTYTAKHKQRDNNKKFFKSKLWQKKLAQIKKEQEQEKRK